MEVEGVRPYHAGDTDPVPEMKDLRPDIALIPVGGMFAMNWVRCPGGGIEKREMRPPAAYN